VVVASELIVPAPAPCEGDLRPGRGFYAGRRRDPGSTLPGFVMDTMNGIVVGTVTPIRRILRVTSIRSSAAQGVPWERGIGSR